MIHREVALELLQLRPESLDPLLQTLQIPAGAFVETGSVTSLLTQRVQGATRATATAHALLRPHAALTRVPLGCELAAWSSSGIPRRAELTALPLHVELTHALTFPSPVAIV